jgi:moderate conductance mechanosensitive channel
MGTVSQLFSLDYYRPVLANGARIGFILVLAYLCTLIAGRLLRTLRTYSVKMMLRAGGVPEFELEKRAETVGSVARKSMFVLIWAIAWIMILRELNFDIRPLLAGAGVVGVAVGFGAQSIVKDVFSGLFMLIENQIRVNDVAVINGKGGLVEEINLRTTVLRGEDGAVHVFQNGNIQTLANMTREYSYYVISVSIAYKEDTDHVIAVIQEIASQLAQEEPYRDAILGPLDMMGVDELKDSAVVIKLRFKTLPSKQWLVGREMNRRIKIRFQEAQIEMGFPTQVVRFVPGLTPELRDELKELVREVLAESNSPSPQQH